eukprot:jgi/Bigna1/84319/fgenesh1_pg.129_\
MSGNSSFLNPDSLFLLYLLVAVMLMELISSFFCLDLGIFLSFIAFLGDYDALRKVQMDVEETFWRTSNENYLSMFKQRSFMEVVDRVKYALKTRHLYAGLIGHHRGDFLTSGKRMAILFFIMISQAFITLLLNSPGGGGSASFFLIPVALTLPVHFFLVRLFLRPPPPRMRLDLLHLSSKMSAFFYQMYLFIAFLQHQPQSAAAAGEPDDTSIGIGHNGGDDVQSEQSDAANRYRRAKICNEEESEVVERHGHAGDDYMKAAGAIGQQHDSKSAPPDSHSQTERCRIKSVIDSSPVKILDDVEHHNPELLASVGGVTVLPASDYSHHSYSTANCSWEMWRRFEISDLAYGHPRLRNLRYNARDAVILACFLVYILAIWLAAVIILRRRGDQHHNLAANSLIVWGGDFAAHIIILFLTESLFFVPMLEGPSKGCSHDNHGFQREIDVIVRREAAAEKPSINREMLSTFAERGYGRRFTWRAIAVDHQPVNDIKALETRVQATAAFAHKNYYTLTFVRNARKNNEVEVEFSGAHIGLQVGALCRVSKVVPGSQTEKAGIRVGWRVLMVEGEHIETPSALLSVLKATTRTRSSFKLTFRKLASDTPALCEEGEDAKDLAAAASTTLTLQSGRGGSIDGKYNTKDMMSDSTTVTVQSGGDDQAKYKGEGVQSVVAATSSKMSSPVHSSATSTAARFFEPRPSSQRKVQFVLDLVQSSAHESLTRQSKEKISAENKNEDGERIAIAL